MAEASVTEDGDTSLPKEDTDLPEPPQLQWSENPLSLGELNEDASFPRVVELQETEPGSLPPGLKIYTRQPVLLYTHTRKRQAKARTIYKERGGAYYEVGQTLLIPEDYEGWFELVPSDFQRARCYQSIEAVSRDMPRKIFLRSNVKAIRMVKNEAGEQNFLERKIPAGSVLNVDSIFSATWKTSAQTGFFKKKSSEWVSYEVKYLKCVDNDQKEVLVPLTQKGKFNAVFERGCHNTNSVYRMKDILSELSLPIKVRLLYGKAPVVPCIFTGILVIREKPEEQSIVGSTVLNKRNVLFELPLSAKCVAIPSTNANEALGDNSAYKDARRLCKKYALVYSTMIKLSPDMDTGQQMVQHIPTDSTLKSSADEALRAFDLITDISLTDEPRDHFLESDTDSIQSDDQTALPRGQLIELKEFRSRDSYTNV